MVRHVVCVRGQKYEISALILKAEGVYYAPEKRIARLLSCSSSFFSFISRLCSSLSCDLRRGELYVYQVLAQRA